jgi:4-amino-4-deoxy-L-arabinose transferase-like glycosyltransferase
VSKYRGDAPTSALIGLILLGAAIVRCWALTFGLPNPEIRPDETTIVGVALGLTYAGLNPHFFHWPSLEFYVVAAMYRLWFIYGHQRGWYHIKFDMFRAAAVDPTPWIMVPRILAAAAGIATVWLVYRLARDLFDRTTALVAAFFLAIAFLHVRDSHFGVTDVPMTFLAVAAMLPLSRLFADPLRRRDWMKAGVLIGLAASTKYNGGVMAGAGVAVAILALASETGRPHRAAIVRHLGAFGAACALAFLAGTPFSLLDASHFIEGLKFDNTHLLGGHGVLLGRGWSYHLIFSLWFGLGPPLLIAGVVGMFLLTVRSWRKAVLVCTFPVLYYLLVGRGTTVFVRYVTPLMPFLCITAAVAVMEMTNRLIRGSAARRAAIVTVSAVLAWPSIQRVIAFDALIAQVDTRLLADEWLAAHAGARDWIAEEAPALLHSNFASPVGLHVARFDFGRDQFVSFQGEVVQPDWIVLPRAPLSPYMVGATRLLQITSSGYDLSKVIIGAEGNESPKMFDEQDMFVVPYSDFAQRARPGPDVYIYHKR